MKRNNNSFYEKKVIDVSVELGSEIFYGKIEYGGFGIPTFRLNTIPDSTVFYEHIRNNPELTCRTIPNFEDITLHGTTLSGGQVIADYISTGKPAPKFDTLEINLTGLSVWIEGRRGFQCQNERLERDISTEKLSETFTFRSENYLLKNHLRVNTHNESPVKCSFEFEHTLVIQKMHGILDFDECRDLAHEARNLFSLLTGHALSVSDVWIFNNKTPSIYQWLYFPSVLYSQTPLQKDFEAICDFSSLTEEKKWAEILSCYFSNTYFRDIWNRIVPSYGKMGAWEYDILSRVIILEMYASKKTASKKIKLDKGISKQFMLELRKTIDDFSKSRNLSGDNLKVYEGMSKSILSTKNTSLPTLREKYEALMEQLSPELRKAISFNENDFNRIKSLRDSTAHGAEYERHSQDGDISHEMQLSDRLLALLICLAYLDLGFTEKEIAYYFQRSHCSFIRNADMNRRELDQIIGEATFIKLATPPQTTTLRNYDTVILDYSTANDSWHLNEESTVNLHTKWHKSGVSNLLDYIKNIHPQKEDKDFETLHKVYIQSGGVETEHLNAIVIRE
ncbi:HEPN domain-containing protein [Pantoea ananatis]|uniref:ApeA N-terminal domain 1-containing protein n=1 Tax=Pantoea ananas TaxID=553 RepID=UPI00024175F4|nr:HEPN domain-containing protein [Pantoea ananatis]CCF10236.1 hypothetical protein PANA5342_2843 [Pantoea ananatis LMG 5342]